MGVLVLVKRKINNKKSYFYLALVLLAIGIFFLGENFGNGNIYFGKNPNINKELSANVDYSSVNQLYKIIRDNYDGNLTNTQVLDGLKTGLANSTNDQYTEYFNASQTKDFNNQLNESFSGIGAQMGLNANKQLIIVSPLSGFPADKAGLQAQDIVTSINNQSTTGMNVDTAVGKIRGPENTYVTLNVLRDGNQELTFKIKRQNITIPSVTSKIIGNNIGYITISQFTQDTADLAQKAAEKFVKDKVNGVVLDLRGNPGGLVTAAVSVSSLWLNQGEMVMQEKNQTQILATNNATGGNILHGIPTVVLVDAGSASASEIVAGAMHDHNDATIVGVKTFGKGVVQQIFNLSGGAEAKITVAKWYRPNGQNIQHKGITPDKTVTLTRDQVKAGDDAQLNAALGILPQS
jgi:carboxyl-terminal processing protease